MLDLAVARSVDQGRTQALVLVHVRSAVPVATRVLVQEFVLHVQQIRSVAAGPLLVSTVLLTLSLLLVLVVAQGNHQVNQHRNHLHHQLLKRHLRF